MADPSTPMGLSELILGSIRRGLSELFSEEAPIVTESGLATGMKRDIQDRPSNIDAAVAAAEGKTEELTFTRR